MTITLETSVYIYEKVNGKAIRRKFNADLDEDTDAIAYGCIQLSERFEYQKEECADQNN